MKPSLPLLYARNHRRRFVAELAAFLRFASVSSQPSSAPQVQACAAWLASHLNRIGLEHVRVIPTSGHPLVYAEWLHAPDKPTLLVYGHYDVLPAWAHARGPSHAFRPRVQADRLYARGSSDDKGQLFCHVKAIESYLQTWGRLPVNVKCLFEGEEEIGSPHLPAFIRNNVDSLNADAVVISDTHMLGPERPAISYAQRGGLRAEVTVTGTPQELHSGTFGGAVHNPLQALCEMLARLHRTHGLIAIPGLYDDVQSIAAAERAYMAAHGPSDEAILRDARSHRPWGEPDYSLYERTTARPSLTISGIAGGHAGTGVKSIIPATATAKLSFRLVPHQHPEKIAKMLRQYIAQITPPTVRSSVRVSALIAPAVIDRKHPALHAAAQAYAKTFGRPPVWVRSGGSIPVVNVFQDTLQCPVALMGFALPDSRIHAANENLHLPTFYRAIDTCIWYQTLLPKAMAKHRGAATMASTVQPSEVSA